jgi:hypothetical protein
MFLRRARVARTAPFVAAALALAVVGAALVTSPDAFASAPTPRGSLDGVEVYGDTISVDGWAWSGVSGPTEVHFYDQARGATWIGKVSTSTDRPDVARAVPGAPTTSGFAGEFRLPDGAHRVCAYAIGGTNPLIGCLAASTKKRSARDVTVGALDAVSRDRDGIRVRGWAWDPQHDEGLGSISITDETGGAVTELATVADGQPRPDVNRAFPGAYMTTGFDLSLLDGVPQGDRRICASSGAETGRPVKLGCVTVAGVGAPFGSYDGLVSSQSGQLVASGWAFDWSGQSTNVHLYDNGRFLASVGPDLHRTDVVAAYPGSPDVNGWSARLTVPAGTHSVCAYAIGTPAGDNPWLGCRTVTVR